MEDSSHEEKRRIQNVEDIELYWIIGQGIPSPR